MRLQMKAIITTILILMCSSLLLGQWHIEEGFEETTTLPDGWSYFDDGDGQVWHSIEHAYSHSGARAAFVDNYLPNQNEDWLITPQISVNSGDELEFYTRSWYSTENLKVYVSTTTPQINSFNTLLLNLQDIGNSYQMGSVSLDSFAGMNIYIGFLWECENYGILLDDVRIGQQQVVDPELNLPDAISFFSSDEYAMDFSEYIVCTDAQYASLSVEDNPHIEVEIAGFMVSFSAPGYVGQEQITFTLSDDLSGLNADADLSVNVLPDPAADLFVAQVVSPREYEFLQLPLIPEILIGNAGAAEFNNDIEVQLTVFDEDEAVLHTDNVVFTGEITPNETIGVSFPASFIPDQEGVLNFVFEILTQDDFPDNNTLIFTTTVVYRITSGGPDDFGYRFLDSNDPLGPDYDWIDISQTGESTIMYEVPSWGGDDNFSEPIPLSFDFSFYGSTYSTAYVDVNGEILLADNTWYTGYPGLGWENDGNMFNYMYPIPGYSQMPALIAVYWDDLHADQGTGNVYFESFGTEPNRYTIIQWDDVRFHTGSGGDSLLKFQVILHESGEIKMQYHTVATGQTGASVPHDHGRSATLAIQNEAAASGLVYLREIVQDGTYIGVEPAGNLLHDELAILFYSGEDTQAPIISHRAVGNTFAQELEFAANIIDMSLPLSASLFFNDGSGWQEQSVTTVSDNDYYFLVQDLPLGSTVEYYIEAEDSEGNLSRLPEDAPDSSFSFQILPTPEASVLIAYSGNQDYQRIELPIYEALLTELDIAYDIYDWEEYPSFSFPDQYQGILAYANTGTASDKMYVLAEALINYLDLGTAQEPKNLWFSSDGLASSQHAHPNSSLIRRLMSGYFRTSYVATGFGGGTNGLGGPNNYNYEHGTILALPGTQVGTEGVEYPVYANSPDCIFPKDAAGDPFYEDVPYPEIGANYIYAFEDGPINGQAYLYHGVAATTVDTPSYRTMYFSFDFSQLTQDADRLEWMEDLMSWWEISPVSNSDTQAPNAGSGLQSINPNPFNPSTTIRYKVTKTQPVSLVVYNLKGQKVCELVNASKSAGVHSISWDGKDANGRPVSSGVYYLRMSTSDTTQTRKLTMIK